MAEDRVVKRAKYKTSTKTPGVPGLLRMSEEKFVFMPNDSTSSEKLEVEFRSIKGHKFTKEGGKQIMLNLIPDPAIKGGSYIFEFENFSDRNVCREFVGNILGKYTDSVKARVEESNVKGSIEQLSKEEVERRVNLLTEAEFWATRKTNKVTFSLTPEIILQIFAEKPAVHRAFLTHVPKKMTEKDFWTKYFRAEFLHNTKNAHAAAAEAADDEGLAIFLKRDDIL